MHVYIVFARSRRHPLLLALLGIFTQRVSAEKFIAQAPKPQRNCLEIHICTLNEPTSDPFWTGTRREDHTGPNARPPFSEWEVAKRKRAHRTEEAPLIVADVVRSAEHPRVKRRPSAKCQVVYVVFASHGPLAAFATIDEAQGFVESEARSGLAVARLGVSRPFGREPPKTA